MELRDKEIERLKHLLQGGRPHEVISLEAQNISNEKLIGHLNLQVSLLPLKIAVQCLKLLCQDY